MRRTSLVTVVVAGSLALSGTAGAEIATFSEATRGTLHVLSSVLLSNKSVDMRGGWFNTSLSCTTSRRLRVVARIFRSTSNRSDGFGSVKEGAVMNCAEGGPNFGFTFSAAAAGMDCPDGSWKPGRYDFVTKTRHIRSDLVSTATLGWANRERC